MRLSHLRSTWTITAAMLAVALPSCTAAAPPSTPVGPAPRAAVTPEPEKAATPPQGSASAAVNGLAGHACPAGVASRERARIVIADGVARFAPSSFSLPDDTVPQRVVWQEDLDGDGRLDVAVFHAACGNHGECMYGVYAQCDGGVFAPVFEAEYLAVAPTPTDQRDGGWRRLKTGERVQDPTTLLERVDAREMRFEHGAYVVR